MAYILACRRKEPHCSFGETLSQSSSGRGPGRGGHQKFPISTFLALTQASDRLLPSTHHNLFRAAILYSACQPGHCASAFSSLLLYIIKRAAALPPCRLTTSGLSFKRLALNRVMDSILRNNHDNTATPTPTPTALLTELEHSHRGSGVATALTALNLRSSASAPLYANCLCNH